MGTFRANTEGVERGEGRPVTVVEVLARSVQCVALGVVNSKGCVRREFPRVSITWRRYYVFSVTGNAGVFCPCITLRKRLGLPYIWVPYAGTGVRNTGIQVWHTAHSAPRLG